MFSCYIYLLQIFLYFFANGLHLLNQGYYRDASGAMIFVDLDQVYNDNCTLSIDRAKKVLLSANTLVLNWGCLMMVKPLSG